MNCLVKIERRCWMRARVWVGDGRVGWLDLCVGWTVSLFSGTEFSLETVRCFGCRFRRRRYIPAMAVPRKDRTVADSILWQQLMIGLYLV